MVYYRLNFDQSFMLNITEYLGSDGKRGLFCLKFLEYDLKKFVVKTRTSSTLVNVYHLQMWKKIQLILLESQCLHQFLFKVQMLSHYLLLCYRASEIQKYFHFYWDKVQAFPKCQFLYLKQQQKRMSCSDENHLSLWETQEDLFEGSDMNLMDQNIRNLGLGQVLLIAGISAQTPNDCDQTLFLSLSLANSTIFLALSLSRPPSLLAKISLEGSNG